MSILLHLPLVRASEQVVYIGCTDPGVCLCVLQVMSSRLFRSSPSILPPPSVSMANERGQSCTRPVRQFTAVPRLARLTMQTAGVLSILMITMMMIMSKQTMVEAKPQASSVPTSTPSNSVPCQCRITPKTVVHHVDKYGGPPMHDHYYTTITCQATMAPVNGNDDNDDSFTNPVFDMSFGASPASGLYLIRGESNCTYDGRQCSSQVRLPLATLRDMLAAVVVSRGVSHQHEHEQPSPVPSMNIPFTCDVADTSRNRAKVRCQDTARIELEQGKPSSSTSFEVSCSLALLIAIKHTKHRHCISTHPCEVRGYTRADEQCNSQ